MRFPSPISQLFEFKYWQKLILKNLSGRKINSVGHNIKKWSKLNFYLLYCLSYWILTTKHLFKLWLQSFKHSSHIFYSLMWLRSISIHRGTRYGVVVSTSHFCQFCFLLYKVVKSSKMLMNLGVIYYSRYQSSLYDVAWEKLACTYKIVSLYIQYLFG